MCEPLLCETYSPQVILLRAHRSTEWHFLHEIKLKGQYALCRISETELVTKGRKLDGSSKPDIDEKYWKRRYNFFSRFDDGIAMDPESWFEVTPETIARHIADRMGECRRICDATAGIGGNAIQFALTPRTTVFCVDIDAERLKKCKHNAGVYGVENSVRIQVGNFLEVEPSRVDAVFISPPWGGPTHLDSPSFSLGDVEGCDIAGMFRRACCAWSRNVVLYLPRHTDLNELVVLAAHHGYGSFEVEKIYFAYPERHLKLIVVYFGSIFGNGAIFPRRRKIVATPACIGDFASCLPFAGPIIRSMYSGILRRYLLHLSAVLHQSRNEEIRAAGKYTKLSDDKVRSIGIAQLVSLLNQLDSPNAVRKSIR